MLILQNCDGELVEMMYQMLAEKFCSNREEQSYKIEIV